MRLITLTIHAAFPDDDAPTADVAADRLVEYLRDGFGAAVAYTSRRDEWGADVPEPADDDPDHVVDEWRDRAYDELETHEVKAGATAWTAAPIAP